jgi:hypothetical protein
VFGIDETRVQRRKVLAARNCNVKEMTRPLFFGLARKEKGKRGYNKARVVAD